jgi:non-canonical poly(A) RNA polymerase PAPD5/7
MFLDLVPQIFICQRGALSFLLLGLHLSGWGYSDVDLCVLNANMVGLNALYKLQKVLIQRGIASSAEVIQARVPIVKMVDAYTDCLVDISMDIPNGPANAGIIKVRSLNDASMQSQSGLNVCTQKFLEQAPVIRPLAMVLKYYLHQLGLNEPYKGGIGSYTLLIMIVSFLQVCWLILRGRSCSLC